MVFEAKSLVFVQRAIRKHFPEPIKQVGKVVNELIYDPTNRRVGYKTTTLWNTLSNLSWKVINNRMMF